MRFILAADHAGFALKEKVKKHLLRSKHEVQDVTPNLVEGDDYPDSAFIAAKEVVRQRASGVFFCGTGTGMCMCANKVKGIRASLGYSEQSAREAKEHENANVLCFGGRTMKEKEVLKMLDSWISASFKGERHARRLEKITRFERFRLY